MSTISYSSSLFLVCNSNTTIITTKIISNFNNKKFKFMCLYFLVPIKSLNGETWDEGLSLTIFYHGLSLLLGNSLGIVFFFKKNVLTF